MRSQRHGGEEIEEHGIDLAPMLDFVLNLLIFFIIVTSFVRETGTEVVRAEARTVEHVEKGNILIAIRPTGEIWMDRRQVDLRRQRCQASGRRQPDCFGRESGMALLRAYARHQTLPAGNPGPA